MGRIVVGVDGSRSCTEALRWAIDEAEVHDHILETVHVCPPGSVVEVAPREPFFAYDPYGRPPTATPRWQREVDDLRHTHEHRAKTHLDLYLEGIEIPDTVKVERTGILGRHPADVLIELSETADLLVVGARGTGGFKEMLLGSVSEQCARHARCPVVVVH